MPRSASARCRTSSLVARRIAPVRAVLVASPDYLARHGRPTTPGDLAWHECLIYTGSRVAEWQFLVGKRSISIRPAGRLRSDSGEAILQWAIAGLGIAEGPSFLVSEAIERGTLEPLLPDYARPEHGIHVVRPPGSYVPGKVRLLIDTLVERFAGEPHWDRCLMSAHGRERASGYPGTCRHRRCRPTLQGSRREARHERAAGRQALPGDTRGHPSGRHALVQLGVRAGVHRRRHRRHRRGHLRVAGQGGRGGDRCSSPSAT